MDDALYNWRDNVAEFYNEHFSEEEQSEDGACCHHVFVVLLWQLGAEIVEC